MAIVTLVLWVITAAAGVSLLRTGAVARRLAAEAARAQADGEQTPAGAASTTASTAPTVVSAASTAASSTSAAVGAARPGSMPARSTAIPLTADGKPPPVPKAKVTTPPGEHPLLEFSHPALALTGLACWFGFVFVHYRPFAWTSLAILVVAIGLGLTWLIRNAQAVQHQVRAAWRFPRRLVVLHGLAATIGISLTVLTALSASHG